MNPTPSRYTVKKTHLPFDCQAAWDSPFWADIEAITIDNHMGPRPDHFPATHAKICYDPDNLYVIFRVADRYVKCLATEYGGPVWQDSCVEFFFAPGPDTAQGYFNIETNACGVILMAHQKARDTQRVPVKAADASRIEIYHSLPGTLDREITEPVEWTLQYRLPLTILSPYAQVTAPAPGVEWKANLYKCGDNTAKPHWLTWSKIDLPQPDFHQPDFFGTLIFED